MLALTFVLASCNGEKKEQKVEQPKAETLVVENTISTDREFMFLNYGGDYRWFETCILMENYMDEETNGNVSGVTSVFQVITETETGYDTHVIMTVYTLDTSTVEVKHAFWVEDSPLNDENIKLTFAQAFEKAMEANCVKPHSKHCVLRKEVGPKDANAQYIFGNSRGQIYVDAVTGDVTEYNPVFSGPLGEWP